MQRAALRSIYGSSQHKTKHAAAVSPILDQSDLDGDESPYPSADQAQRTLSNNNWSTNMVNTPQDEDEDDAAAAAAGVVLQRKSALYEIPPLATMTLRGSGSASNQDADGGALPSSSGSAQKYAVLGQKQQWRKNRAQRSRRGEQTISPVEEDPSDAIDDDVDLENPTPSREVDLSPRFSINETNSSSRSSSRGDSERYESEEQSSGRTSSFSGDEKQRFVVTRQKKSKFAARIHLPGQNPLYLGRYKSAEAALAACEQAFATITTPRK